MHSTDEFRKLSKGIIPFGMGRPFGRNEEPSCIEDDRNDDQKTTHICLIVGVDMFLSGWGQSEKRLSVACWACTQDDAENVETWVNSRGDMAKVRVMTDSDLLEEYSLGVHVHIYVVDSDHPSLT